ERHAPGARLLANATSAHQLAPWQLADRITVVDDSAGERARPGRWLEYDGVRVMPLRTRHAPHFDGHVLFRGERDRDLSAPPATAQEWLDGDPVSYLVDFVEEGAVAFRLYYQDAVAAEPYGLVPDELLRDGPDARAVDLAILVPSTFAEVPWHPEAILDNLRPRHVLLGHWEDFFDPPLEAPTPLFLNDFGQFTRRLERGLAAVSEPPAGWHLPVAGVRFRLR